jgi:antitoxin YefM
MRTIRVSDARADLYNLIEEVAASHKPVKIMGKRGNVIAISEEDWQAVEETLYLTSIKGMRESILEGMATSVKECSSELEW